MNGSSEDQCGRDNTYQYSNPPLSSSPTTGGVDEAAFLQGELPRPEGIPTGLGIVLATSDLGSGSLYPSEINPSLLATASFNSTETSLIGISPNVYENRYLTSAQCSFDDFGFYDYNALEFQGLGDEHLTNQQEQRLRTHTRSQDIYPSSKTGNTTRPQCDECGWSFRRNSELKRHQQSIHNKAGRVCGDCRNEGVDGGRVRRDDHFLKHFREKHGFSGSAKTYPTCSFTSCQPENQHQKLCFTTEDSLNLHLQKIHGTVLRYSEPVPKDQTPSSTGPTGSSGQTVNSKRIWQETQAPIHGTKRLRSSSTPILDSNLDKGAITSSEGITPHTPAQDNAATGYRTPESATEEDITCYIENVSAYEFIRAKSRWNQISESFSSKCWVPGSPLISYDAPRRRIRLCMRTPYGGDIKASVTRHLEAARDSKYPVLLVGMPENRLTYGDQHYSDSHPPITTSREASDSAKVFPIRRKEDSLAVKLWNEFIIPALPKILDEPMKTGYTACLVRKGATLESATPIIRIESPLPPGKSTKESILTLLDSACVPSLQSVKIRVQFCTGSMVYLSGEIEEDEENRGEADRNLLPLPLHNTYWENAGMGASIGLLCSNTEFATLGCYLNVDGENFILTVDHFIQKSYESLDRDRGGDRNTLTSPAIAKVRSIKTLLEHSFSGLEAELQAEVDKNPNLLELPDLNTPLYEPILQLAGIMEQVELLLKDCQKKDIEYKIGSLSYRCESGSVALLSQSHSTVRQYSQSSNGIEPGVRLDWALFAVDRSSRKGRNRYRQKRHESGRANIFPDQACFGEGEGEICRQTSIVEGNEQVRFVGGRNGSLEGQVNGTLQVVRYEGRTTLEHHIVMCPDYNRPAAEHAGASGTMVVKVPNNEILGMIWACNEDSGQPVFTPIHTIFDNIRKVTRAENVNLDQYPEPEMSASNIRLISGSERDAPKLAPLRSSDFRQLVLSSDEKARLSKSVLTKFALRPRDRSVSDVPLGITAMVQPQVQAPSLSSSRASSPESLPPTPVLKSIEVGSTADCAGGHISIIGEDTVRSLVIEEADGDAIQGDDLQALLGNDSATENKISIQFLPSGGQQKSLVHLFSPKPSRRWSTWPVETGRSWNNSAEEPGQLKVMAQ